MATTAEGATAAGDPIYILECGACTMEQGGKAQRETPPPPSCCSQVPRPVVVLCLRHACDVRATEGRRKGRPSPPPNTTASPRAGNAGRGGGRKAPPPPPRATRQGGEAEVGGCGTSHTTVTVEGARRASPGGGTTGGAGEG